MAAILWLWVPAFVFAHVWAALFIWRLVRVARPREAQRAASAPSSAEANTDVGQLSRIPITDNPVQPVSLSWSGVGCSYSSHGGTKVVLKDVSGSVAAGEMAALMGPSGAGKSTLMDILAGRKSTGNLSGTVYNNGRPRSKADKQHTAYVPQDTLMVPSMTVMETCFYYAALTLPPATTKAQQAARINAVLGEMGLSHAAPTLVGGVLPGGLLLRGLSGGERKRLAIATGLLAGPSLLFLDEPTSGLDSYAAWSVMCTLCALAHNAGHTVVASVHQPRASIWNLFDQVLLLSKGLLLYSGPRTDLVPWFQGLGYHYDPDTHGLPCDWVMDLVNVDFRSKAESAARTGEGISVNNGSSVQLLTMTSLSEVEQAASLFKQQQQQQQQQQVVDVPKGGAALQVMKQGVQGGLKRDSRDQVDVGQSTESNRTSSSFCVALELVPAAPGACSPKAADGIHSSVKDTAAASDASVDVSPASAAVAQQETALAGSSTSSSVAAAGDEEAVGPQPQHSWLKQLRVLMWRELLAISRNPADAAGRMIVFAYVAFGFGGLYYDLGNGLDAIQMRLNFLYLVAQLLLLLPYIYMSLYTTDKQFFIADTNAGLISPSAYYVAKQLVALPLQLVPVAVSCCIFYGMAGLRREVTAFFTMVAANALVYLIASQVLAAAAIITTNQDATFMVSVTWTAFNFMLSNYLVRYKDMNWQWLAALRWVAILGFAQDTLYAAELKGTEYPCTKHTLDGGLLSILEELFPNTSLFKRSLIEQTFASSLDTCVLKAGALAEYFRGFSSTQLCFGVLLLYLAVVHAISYLGLKLAAKREAR